MLNPLFQRYDWTHVTIKSDTRGLANCATTIIALMCHYLDCPLMIIPVDEAFNVNEIHVTKRYPVNFATSKGRKIKLGIPPRL